MSGVSDATVVRFCKRIGYVGFYQMKLQLSHDMGQNTVLNEETERIEDDFLQKRMMMIAQNVQTIAKHLDAEALKRCAAAIDRSETVFVIGNGYNKILAADVIYRLTRMGIRCSGGGYSETDMENLCLGKENDVAIFISRSGEHKKTYTELQFAKEKKMITIALTDAIKCPLAQAAEYALCTGMEDRANIFVHRNSSALNMTVLVEVLLDCVSDRLTNKNYLDDVVSEDRM
jgi:DNA-binding MurR/RpiR family transcriptional regulator